MILGFTGTRQGMTLQQKQAFYDLLRLADRYDNILAECHHGDCTGSDLDAHILLRHYEPKFAVNRKRLIPIVIHPGTNARGNSPTRAYCGTARCVMEGGQDDQFVKVLMPKPYLERDRDIANACDVLIATPRGFVEEKSGSGTWATARYADKNEVPVIVIWPDGNAEEWTKRQRTIFQ